MPSNTPNFLTQPAVPELPSPAEGPVLLPSSPEPRMESGRSHRRLWLGLTFVIILVLLLALAPLGYGLARAGGSALQLRKDLQAVQSALLVRDFDGALAGVDQAEHSLDGVRAGLRATGGWKFMPLIGARIQAFETVARSGASALDAARDLLQAAQSVQDALASAGVLTQAGLGVEGGRSFNDLSVDERREILARVAEILPELRLAREKVDIALTAWQQVPQDDLIRPAREALEPFARTLPTLKRQLDEVTSVAEVILPLVGYPTPKNYLVLLQNADELRPTGGFIGTIGELEVNTGSIVHFVFDDVYNVDGPAVGWNEIPPDPMRRELGVSAWFLRDSNWSPDFPTSAALAMRMYEGERAVAGITADVNGVIALQPGFFHELLKLTGPLVVEGKTFDAENFFDELQYDVEIGFREDGTPVPQRKEVVAKVGQELMAKVFAMPAERWPALLELAMQALGRKDILVFDPDPNVLPLLDARGWTGRMGESQDQDFLGVVDANLAALKTDGMMDKQIIYQLDAANPEQAVATVRLRYTNRTRQIDWRYTRYRSYTRLYVPEGSELISVQGGASDVVDIGQELGKRVFGAFWVVEPGRTRELIFRYRLPASALTPISQGSYQLRVQRQPGANTSLTLDHAFGKNIQSAVPGEDSADFGDQRYQVTQELTSDADIEVLFRR